MLLFRWADEAAELARIELLEDQVKRLERRFVKLQGEVTQSWRDRYDDQDYPDEEEAGG